MPNLECNHIKPQSGFIISLSLKQNSNECERDETRYWMCVCAENSVAYINCLRRKTRLLYRATSIWRAIFTRYYFHIIFLVISINAFFWWMHNCFSITGITDKLIITYLFYNNLWNCLAAGPVVFSMRNVIKIIIRFSLYYFRMSRTCVTFRITKTRQPKDKTLYKSTLVRILQ